MKTPRVLGVIPARLASSRLPRKPLHRLAGRPLIEWVWRRVAGTELFDQLVVATDSKEIVDVARAFGATVELTDPAHPSGTDRVAEVAARPDYRAADAVVNIQGDEPFVRGAHLQAAIDLVGTGGWDVGTVASPVRTQDAWRDPAVVKVVRDRDGGAMFFSRAPIPHRRDGVPGDEELAGEPFLRHVGIYSYRPDALLRWVALPESRLEQIERLEQLRPLAAGIRIGVALVDQADGGVDTPDDAAAAEKRLLALSLSAQPPGA